MCVCDLLIFVPPLQGREGWKVENVTPNISYARYPSGHAEVGTKQAKAAAAAVAAAALAPASPTPLATTPLAPADDDRGDGGLTQAISDGAAAALAPAAPASLATTPLAATPLAAADDDSGDGVTLGSSAAVARAPTPSPSEEVCFGGDFLPALAAAAEVRPWDLVLASHTMMICLPPQGNPPPHTHAAAAMAHSTHSTQHTASTAATPRYPQGRRQTPADAPTPLKLRYIVWYILAFTRYCHYQ